MAAICDAVINLCAVRATRLNNNPNLGPVGEPAAGPNNVYVTNKPISLSVTPEIEAGADKTLVSGCDCIIATYKGPDKLKRFTFEVDIGNIEPGLMEMMIGATPITSAGNAVGLWYPEQLTCDDTPQPNVMLEGWQDLWENDHQNPTFPFVHWIWPSTFWQMGPHTLQNEFLQPRVTGFSRGNTAIYDVYGDLSRLGLNRTIQPLGGFFYDTHIPAAICGYQTQSLTNPGPPA